MEIRVPAALLFVLPLAAASIDPPLDRLQVQLEQLAAKHHGVVGVAAIHLESGRRVSVRGGEPFPMASTVKVPLAVQLLHRADKAEIRLDQPIDIQPHDLHPGSGTLSDLFTQPGVRLSVRNLMELMLRISDNSATDILLRTAGGGEAVTARMHELGIEGIQVNRPTAQLIADWDGAILPPENEWTQEKLNHAFDAVTPELQKQRTAGLRDDKRDTATPDGMAFLLEKLWKREILTPASDALLLDIMAHCDTGLGRLKGMLPAGTLVAHKTGTMGTENNVTDDVGIITLPGTAGHVAIAVFVKWSEEPAAQREHVIAELARTVYDYFLFVHPQPSDALNYGAMADRIVKALALQPRERVRMWGDPEAYPKLAAALKQRIPGAELLSRTSVAPGSLENMLRETDVFLWLPIGEDWRAPSPDEAAALARWLDAGGSHREIHFHWPQGSVLADGLPTAHPTAYDGLYQSALDIDYAALSKDQDQAIARFRSGVVRVTTPEGTDLHFEVKDRPFDKQDGNASAERMKTAKVRVDREIELPAGALRVAPVEETVEGRIVVPLARFGDEEVRNLRLEIEHGRVIKTDADENLTAAEAEFRKGGEAAKRFREFALGFNPKLKGPPGSPVIPYYAYGQGMVRLSLGDNEELGGAVRGGWRRWFFFPDATVEMVK